MLFLKIIIVGSFSMILAGMLLGQQKEATTYSVSTIDSLNNRSAMMIKAPNTNQGLEYARIAASESKKANYLKGLAEAYYNIGDYYYFRYEKDSAFFYFKLSTGIAELIDHKSLVSQNQYSIAHIYFEIDKYDEALQFAKSAISEADNREDSIRLAKINKLICEVYNFKGENEKSIDYCIACLDLYENLNDPVGKANVLNVIGNIYTQFKVFNKAEKHLQEALYLGIEHGDQVLQATSYSSLAELHFAKGEYSAALANYNLAYAIDTVIYDTLGLAYSSFSMGKTYLIMDSVEKSLEYLNKSLVFSQIVQDNDLISNTYAMMGKAYHVKGRNKEALDYLEKSLIIATEIDAYPILHFVNKTIAEYYEKSGNPKTALHYYKQYMQYDDRLKHDYNARKIAEVDAIYDLAHKERQIEILTKENEIQTLQARQRELMNKGLVASVFFTLIMAGILFSRNRIKNKANRELKRQKEAINHQKEEIEQQRDDIQQKSLTLSEFNKQITDSIEYARRIQLSLFPSGAELKLIFPESFIFNKPKDIISGDFYWVTTMEDKIYLAVVDCTGHGVPGAFMTILASSLLNQIILENKITCPGMTLSLLDIKVKQNLHMKENSLLIADGMDMGLCVIDKSRRTVEFAGAKFSLYYSDHNKLCQVNGNRYPIGSMLFPDKNFTSTTIQLSENSTFYLGTDGFQDQFGGPNDTKFMKTNFRKLLSSLHKYPIYEQYNLLCESFYTWKGAQQQTDDILVVGIKL